MEVGLIEELGILNINQGPFFMRNSQLFHEIIVSKSYTKAMEIRKATKQNIRLLNLIRGNIP